MWCIVRSKHVALWATEYFLPCVHLSSFFILEYKVIFLHVTSGIEYNFWFWITLMYDNGINHISAFIILAYKW